MSTSVFVELRAIHTGTRRHQPRRLQATSSYFISFLILSASHLHTPRLSQPPFPPSPALGPASDLPLQCITRSSYVITCEACARPSGSTQSSPPSACSARRTEHLRRTLRQPTPPSLPPPNEPPANMPVLRSGKINCFSCGKSSIPGPSAPKHPNGRVSHFVCPYCEADNYRDEVEAGESYKVSPD